jgi:hypothetical protein
MLVSIYRELLFHKTVQNLAHADDIDITGRIQRAMKEAFISLEKAAKKSHLQIRKKTNIYICQ